jgi:DNA primase
MDFAQQLKSQLDIVEVVGQYVRLKRRGAGARYIGLCPFHNEKTPSFNVDGAQGYYKCFGCDASGDVFKFVQEMESLTFPEVLKALAEQHGIPMPQRQRPGDPEAQRRMALLEMHEIAAQLFQDNLRGAGGAEARRYLAGRGVSQAATDEFRLGLSDAGGQQLVARLQRFGPEAMEQSGLVGRRQDGNGFFDRFRGRLMFPIHSESGQVIAFGGRALRSGDEPKYLNSPETRIYKKSAVLYNLHRAKIDSRKHDRMILVEGYMDVIGVYSAGVKEVVASCGTALSNDQVRAIKRQTSQQQAGNGQVILNFDPDAAGQRSTEKYVSSFLAEGLRVRILELPGGLDPDEFIQQHGLEGYQRHVNNAPSFFHWLTERVRERFGMQSAEGRVDAFKAMLPALQLVHDRVERSAIAGEIAVSLKLDRELVAEQLRPATRREPAQKSTAATSVIPPNEVLLLTCFVLSSNARSVIQQYVSERDILPLLETRAVLDAALAMEREGLPFAVGTLTGRLETRLQGVIAHLSFGELGIAEHEAPEQALRCLQALEDKGTQARRSALKDEIRRLELSGDLMGALQLTQELDRLGQSASGM